MVGNRCHVEQHDSCVRETYLLPHVPHGIVLGLGQVPFEEEPPTLDRQYLCTTQVSKRSENLPMGKMISAHPRLDSRLPGHVGRLARCAAQQSEVRNRGCRLLQGRYPIATLELGPTAVENEELADTEKPTVLLGPHDSFLWYQCCRIHDPLHGAAR